MVENVSVDMKLEKSPDVSPVRSNKDVRVQLYSKIGLTKPKGERRIFFQINLRIPFQKNTCKLPSGEVLKVSVFSMCLAEDESSSSEDEEEIEEEVSTSDHQNSGM